VAKILAAKPAIPSDSYDVLGLDWYQFLYGAGEWKGFRKLWEPGQHISVDAPTGAGKTVFCTGILTLRRYVLAMDAKGGDVTLKETGWPRVTGKIDRLGHFLPYEHRKSMREGEPCRVIVGKVAKTIEDVEANWPLQEQVMRKAFADKGWTIYIPDLQLLTDPRLGGIGRTADTIWIAARDRGVSLVADMQQFAWTPRLARSMPRWFVIGYTKDFDSVEAMARAAGRSNAEIKGMVQALKHREFSWLVFSNNPRHPVIVTVPII
jgi:hypothetical protein